MPASTPPAPTARGATAVSTELVTHGETGGRAASSLNATLSAVSQARSDARHESTRHALQRTARTQRRGGGWAKPVIASVLAVGLLGSGVAYVRSTHLVGAEPSAFVVGSGVLAQTDDLARAATVDLTYRDAASVSRNERRTALAATEARDAAALEARQKAEAAKKAAAAAAEAERVAQEQAKQQLIANAKKDPKAVARMLMVDQGWTSDRQYGCLVNLWNGESDWRWFAENASSGAYGIAQSLPASKMAQFGDDYRTNPVTQITWGLWYLKMSYGNPCNAWATWQSRSPHWY